MILIFFFSGLALSLLFELSKHRQFHYIVGIRWLYPNTLAKVQWCICNNGSLYIANHIHNTLTPTHYRYWYVWLIKVKFYEWSFSSMNGPPILRRFRNGPGALILHHTAELSKHCTMLLWTTHCLPRTLHAYFATSYMCFAALTTQYKSTRAKVPPPRQEKRCTFVRFSLSSETSWRGGGCNNVTCDLITWDQRG